MGEIVGFVKCRELDVWLLRAERRDCLVSRDAYLSGDSGRYFGPDLVIDLDDMRGA